MSRVAGYVGQNGTVLKSGSGQIFGHGHKVNCTKIRPGAPGSWISNERCSYRFKVDGRWYACRGMGDEMAASCRVMKKPPRGFSGAVGGWWPFGRKKKAKRNPMSRLMILEPGRPSRMFGRARKRRRSR